MPGFHQFPIGYGIMDDATAAALPKTVVFTSEFDMLRCAAEELAAKLGSTRFVSATYRIFKPSSNPSREKVKVTYNGEIPEVDTFQLAQNYQLKKNEARALPVEISADLKASR